MNLSGLFRSFTRTRGSLLEIDHIESLDANQLADVVGGNQFLSKLQEAEANDTGTPVFTSSIDEFLAETDD
ncbi:hypothetical protein [Rudanella lutea]|uniref:hypothetical protein n=1 Tax=Rudanella lutea TaxID=451374 RepID=UPI00037EF5E1|nr:hypothetical protein [Rudanella lutea]